MKKFFALMLVVAMLSVAGSAMAVTISVSGDKTASVVAGKAASFTLVVKTSADTGILSVDVTSGTAKGWVTTVTSTEIAFSVPSTTTAGTYGAVVRARETYTPSDIGGHGSTPIVASADVRVSLDVKAAAPLPEDKKSEIVENVKVINVAKAVIPTLSTQAAIPSTITTELAKTTVVTVVRTIIVNLGITVPEGATVQAGSNMEEAKTDNYDNSGSEAANQANLAKASARLKKASGGNTLRAIGVPAPFKPKASGLQPIDMPVIDKAFYGYPLGMWMGNSGVNAQFAAADANGNSEVAFLNSLGQSVDKVPDASGSWLAGKVTAIAYVEAGKVYEPVLTLKVAAASADSFDEESGTTTVAKVEIIETVAEPVSSDDVFPTGKNFTIHVSDAHKLALERATKLSLDLIPASTVSSDTTRSGDLYIGTTFVEEVALIPRLQNLPASAANHAYVAAFKYARLSSLVSTNRITSAPMFIPDWANQNIVGDVYKITGTSAAKAVSTDVTTGSTGYLVFRVSGDAIAFSAADASFADPRLVAASTPNVTPTPENPGASSSSGGCSAGSAALALAVLGSFILTRKK